MDDLKETLQELKKDKKYWGKLIEIAPKDESITADAIISMAYGKADMKFIHEATGVKEDQQIWENIPVDHVALGVSSRSIETNIL